MVKVLCVLYKGGKDAEEQPRLLGTVGEYACLAPSRDVQNYY